MMQRLEYHIAYACGNHCIFCSESQRLERPYVKFVSLREIRGNLEDCVQKGFNHLTFTGGEPTLHPHFISLASLAKGLGYVTYITTNGWRLGEKDFCRKASCYLDEICFSVHGHSAQLHNFHTRNQDSFRALKHALRNVEDSAEDIAGFANIVVTRYNAEYLPEILKFIADHRKIKQVLFSHFAPEGRALANFRELVVPLERFREMIPQLVGLSLQRKITPRFFGLPLCILKGYEDFSNDLHWSARMTLERYRENGRGCSKKTRSYKPIRGRIKSGNCAACGKRSVCGGLFKVYHKEFGSGELRPW